MTGSDFPEDLKKYGEMLVVIEYAIDHGMVHLQAKDDGGKPLVFILFDDETVRLMVKNMSTFKDDVFAMFIGSIDDCHLMSVRKTTGVPADAWPLRIDGDWMDMTVGDLLGEIMGHGRVALEYGDVTYVLSVPTMVDLHMAELVTRKYRGL